MDMNKTATADFDQHLMNQDGPVFNPIDMSDETNASRVISWSHTTGFSPVLSNHSNEANELTASNDSHKQARLVGRIDQPLIRQESLKLSHSAPNLELFNQRKSQLTPEEYTAQFINQNLKLFEFYHNLASNGQLDQSAEFTDSNEDAVLFERENEIKQLNENAIDFLRNFSTHQYFHQYQQSADETNGSSMAEKPQTSQLADYSEVITQHSNEEDYIKIHLNDQPKVGFLYKNGQDKRQQLIDMASSSVGASTSNFSNDTMIRKNSKVLFSNNDPDEDEEDILETVNPPAIPTDYSVATMLEQNDFAVSDVFELARELKRTYLFKILIMGDSNTGKTSFVKRFTCNSTPRHYMPTIGLEFSMKIIDLKDEKKEVKLQLWDIAGEKSQDSLSKLYYRDAVGAMVFFDCSREASFKNVDKWKEQLDANVRLADGSKLPTILIGNKCDLKKDGGCKDQALIQETCRQFEFNEHFLVSAKANRNVKESIMCLIKLIFDSRMEFTYNQENNIKLDESEEETRSGFRCFC